MKSEDDVRGLLRDAARTYETDTPATPLMIELGRRAKKRRLAWMAGAAAACVVIAVTLGGMALRAGDQPGTVAPAHGNDEDSPAGEANRMPSVIGLSKQDALDRLFDLDGKYGVGVTDDLHAATCDKVGTVIDQDPAPGERLTPAEIGNLVITLGKSAQPYACDDVPAGDRGIAQAFAAFADDMGKLSFPPAKAPFAPSVALGLGNEYERTITGPELTDPDEWRIEANGYATAHGRFSAPDQVDPLLDYTELTTDMSPSSCTVALIDEPSPEITRGGHPVRIRNRDPTSCWQDWFVDLYIDDAGQIVGVNLILGVPEDMQ